MNTLSGKILHAQNHQGIKDLTVLLYDIDFVLAGGFDPTHANDNPAVVPPYLQDLLPHDETNHPLLQYASRVIYYLYAATDESEDGNWGFTAPAGARLGSALSNADGGFSISFEDIAFQNGDQETRPEALLMVLAPDQSLNTTLNDGSPISFIGTPEYQRILHLSFFPLRNMAKEEAVVIKISDTQLQRFGLSNQASQPINIAQVSNQLTLSDQQNSNLVDALRIRSRQNIQLQQEKLLNTDRFVSNLSALPRRHRQGSYFLDRKELTEDRMRSLQTQVSRDGILSVSQQTINNPGRTPQAFISLDEEWLSRILLDQSPQEILDAIALGTPINMEVDYSAFCAMLYNKNGGTELTRKTDSPAKRAIRDEVVARLYALRNPDLTPGDGPGPGGEEPPVVPPSDLSSEEQIKALVMEQVLKLSVAPPSTINSESATEQRERISISLEELMPPVSPADTTAYHDYTSLQIAFPSVWTEAFDGEVEDIIRDLKITYDEAYEVYKEEGGDVLNRLSDFDDNEFHDLKEYTHLLGELTGDISALENNPMPQIVKDLLNSTEATELQPQESISELFSGALNSLDKIFGQGQIASASAAAAAQRPSSTDNNWDQLSIGQQAELIALATEYAALPADVSFSNDSFRTKMLGFVNKEFIEDLAPEKVEPLAKFYQSITGIADQGEQPGNSVERRKELRALALGIISKPEGRSTRAQGLMAELAKRLKAPHSFRIFAENSYNFGILTTHRQKWVPGDYQTGDLVSTITLAPGEKRQYVKKEVLKRTRNRKEEEKSASTLTDERVFTSKATEDIVAKANTSTNFAQNISGSASGSLGVFSMSAQSGTQFGKNQAIESERRRQSIHEATRKAAQEYKNERSLSVSTESASEFESSFTSEISNPNNEITVSYLFYELERQYKVTEHLHKVRPVIMVAQHVPAPHEIDEDWLMLNEWILRRVLLDRSFHPALDFVAEGLISDEVSLEVMREHYETQKTLVEELSDTVGSMSAMQETLRDTLIQTSAREKMAETNAKRAKKRRRRGIARSIFTPFKVSNRIASGASNLTFGQLEDPELLEARREALETRLEYLDGNLDDARLKLNNANSALAQASEDLTVALKESFTRRNLVTQLKLHIKENILYYMQAIWTHEYTHQRYMRLYNLPIDIPMPGPRPSGGNSPRSTVTLSPVPPHLEESLYRAAHTLPLTGAFVGATLQWPATEVNRPLYHTVGKRLHEVADVDNLIGFKGNYMIFPLKECTFITDYMMQDYVDEYLGVRTPDPAADMSTDELLKYAEQIWHHEDTSDVHRDALEQLILERLNSAKTDDELIVVPTGQLFIEAMKGSHALLEHFKLKHRQLDVQKVQEEVRAAQLENLRKALRLVRDEGELLDDPDVDKYIRMEGDGDDTIIVNE